MANAAGIAILIATGFIVALALVIRRVAFCHSSLPVTAEWIADLSGERYRPMLRLLDGSDLEFLRMQPGFNGRKAAKLRQQRCQIFKGYLQSLQVDFGRTVVALKVLMVQAREDRPDLASTLLRHQLMFGWAMVSARARLFLYRFGLGSVDVRNLVRVFDAVQMDLRNALPVGVAA
jgi:hypothetical protein